MDYHEWMENVVKAFEVAGVAVLALGSLWALVALVRDVARGDRDDLYERSRRRIGQALLLGLEILIVADIVLTITIEPTIESVGVLGVLVLIRTVLSFSLEIELDGVVPWRKRRAE